MGLEFLFSPMTMLIFGAATFCLVMLQRFLFRRAFESIGLKQVAIGYGFVFALSIVLGALSGGGSTRASMANGILACYLSFLFVTIGLLPLSLLLATWRKYSIAGIVGSAVALVMLVAIGMLWTLGLDRVAERGAGWLAMQGFALAYLMAISMVFTLGLKSR
jgi:hypothetical protein